MSQGALYFGVDTLIVKCEDWFSQVFSPNEFPLTPIQIEDFIQIWKFASDHGTYFTFLCKIRSSCYLSPSLFFFFHFSLQYYQVHSNCFLTHFAASDFILHLCIGYLARNFVCNQLL